MIIVAKNYPPHQLLTKAEEKDPKAITTTFAFPIHHNLTV